MLKTRILLPFSLLLLLLASCNPDQGAAWKHNDNTVRVRLSSNIPALNPLLARSAWVKIASDLVFQYPMDFDPSTLELAPQLVKSKPVVTDISEGEFAGGQSFSFEILEEAVWDDGQPVTGYDYEFSVKLLFNPKLPLQAYASYFEFVKDIRVDAANPRKFTVITDRKYILNDGVVSNVTMMPRHLYDPEGLMKDFSFQDLSRPERAAAIAEDPRLQQFADAFLSPKYGREVVSGSGPYKVVDWVDDQRIVFAKKENWWGDKLAGTYNLLAAYPDTIIFLPIPDQTAAVAALKSEDYDIGFELETNQFMELRQDSFLQNVYNYYTPPRFAYFYVAMQNRNPKLADKRVRQALARLIDMDAVIRDQYNGLGERIIGPFLPDKKYYHKGLQPVAMDVEGARRLLAEAGWKDSNGNGILDKLMDGQLTELSLTFLYTPGVTFQENFTELFLNNVRQAGVEIVREPVESNVMGQRLRNGEYELAGRGASAYPLPDDPKQLFHTDSAQPGGSNYTRFGNAETDALIEEIRSTTDEAKRNALYQKFQEVIYEEQPMIFQFSPFDRIAAHQRFEAIITRKSPGVSLQHLKLRK
jgi:peptide/nickel transport system substrate-binding protein